jgi:1-acyl-sn-glycerol-3-phosphate acyltransferase
MKIFIGFLNYSNQAHPGNYSLTLQKRKGFVKVALQTGASLVPVIAFGENDLFDSVPNPPGMT